MSLRNLKKCFIDEDDLKTLLVKKLQSNNGALDQYTDPAYNYKNYIEKYTNLVELNNKFSLSTSDLIELMNEAIELYIENRRLIMKELNRYG